MPIVFLLDYKTVGLYFFVIEFGNRTPLLSEIPSLKITKAPGSPRRRLSVPAALALASDVVM